MKTFKVTYEMWRETFNGSAQFDGRETVEIKALNKQSAIKKAIKNRLNAGKGRVWSHSIWTQNEMAELVSKENR